MHTYNQDLVSFVVARCISYAPKLTKLSRCFVLLQLIKSSMFIGTCVCFADARQSLK